MLDKDKKDEIKKASEEGRLYLAEDDSSNQFHCAECGKESPKHFLSICESAEDLEDDPMSGEVILLGTHCFKKLKTELDLK